MSAPDRCLNYDDVNVHVFKTGRWKQNSYIVHDTAKKQIYLIDPGGEEVSIIKLVEALGDPVTLIALTHAHHDHVGALKAVHEHFALPYYLHPADLKLLRRAPLFAISFEARKMMVPTLGQVLLPETRRGTLSNEISYIHTPGHTGGGIVISIGSLAFTGDTLLNKMIGRTDLPGASVTELDASIAFMLLELPEDSTLFPGHGEPWTLSEAKSWWSENRHQPPEYRDEDDERGY